MKVITAPEEYEIQENDICCFIAGGISGCPEWQDKVIEFLKEKSEDDIVIFNPRRKEFDSSTSSANKQIEWEFKYLNRIDIFSMYFCKDRIQPICMYELGQYIEVMKKRFPDDFEDRIVISSELGYERYLDVRKQIELAFDRRNPYLMNYGDPQTHAHKILFSASCLRRIRKYDKT